MLAALRFVLSARFLCGFVLALALGAIASTVSYWRGHSAGFVLGVQTTEAKVARETAKETARQDAANEAARAEQRRRFDNLMTIIEAKNDELETLREAAERGAEGAAGDDIAPPIVPGPVGPARTDGAPGACPPRGISGDSMRTINRF